MWGIVREIDVDVRRHIYDVALAVGQVPSRQECAIALARPVESVGESLERLSEAHQIVLAPDGDVLMAMPFSAVPTPFEVRGHNYRTYANCGWDALGVAVMRQRRVEVATSCPDCGDPMILDVDHEHGVVGGDVRLHFALPVRRWWESVVFT